MRDPYNTLGKKSIVLPQSERMKALKVAHHGPIAGHFARDQTLPSTIRLAGHSKGCK